MVNEPPGWPGLNDPDLNTQASYVVYKQGNSYYAEDCTGTSKDYSGTDAATVIQNAKNNLPAGTGTVFLKKNTYPISRQINWGSNIDLIGEQGTVLQATASMSAILGLTGGGSIARSYVRNVKFDCNNFATSGRNIGHKPYFQLCLQQFSW
jgi:hypothetical protein